MDPNTPADAHPERTETDASLREERERTDEELATQRSVTERDADQVVELARERADALLEETRHKEDAKSRLADKSSIPSEVVHDARASEDEALTEERVAADDDLSEERAEQRLAIAQLLRLEREETDEQLSAERAHFDRRVASRDEFLAMVAHDVRGLLGVIAISTDLLMTLPEDGPTKERTHTLSLRIRRATGRMNRLVGDLLDVVSMELGTLHVDASQQDATMLLTETMANFRVAAEALKVTMTCAAPPGPVSAAFDHDRILQVLSNLVGNAIKFSQAGGTIELRLESKADGLEFMVRDSGRGIAAEYMHTIFERFSQARQPDRRGLGLGLYIARCIVQAHGGRIWADSEPGKGSAFHFTIPEGRHS
jgi:signal transduction histidine kinase